MVVANLEGPITSLDRPLAKLETGHKRYWYRAHPGSVQALVRAGIKVVSLANNHVLDFGVTGLAETLDVLDQAGIVHCGAGLDEAQARLPAIISVGGLRVGFLSYMQRYDLYVREGVYASETRGGSRRLRPVEAREDLEALRGAADVCIALVHWGRNYREVSPRQERLAETLRQAGADLVVGHHPHIVQRVDVTDGRPVLFSLGNGPFGTSGRFHRCHLPYGLVATVEINDLGRISQLDLILTLVDNSEVQFRPIPATGSEADRFLWSLASPSEGFGIGPGASLSVRLSGSDQPSL
jgi:poly-gamma-glutamate capsule biosynthesis protein CapA/YwtB (metallophosphatase superfamily)